MKECASPFALAHLASASMASCAKTPPASRAAVFVLSVMFVLACAFLSPQSSAWADDTVDADNGWVLSYEVSVGGATITGVATPGTGRLAIPSSANGTPVTALKTAAFRNATMTSVYIPSSVAGVSSNCFRNCAALKEVTFEGDKTGFFGPYSFAGCSAIEKFVVPVLTTTYSTTTSYRIADNSFLDCKNLKTIEFLANDEVRGAQSYFTNYNFNSMVTSLFGSTYSPDTYVFYGKRPDFTRWADTDGEPHRYYTVDFYASESDAADYSKKSASVTCESGTPLAGILNGTVAESSLYKPMTGVIPTLPDGKVWGVSDYGRQADDWGLYDSYSAYPVDAADLSYGWVTSPEIKVLTDQGLQDTYWAYARAEFTLDKAGTAVPGIGNIVVHSSDGAVIDPSNYTLEFGKRTMGSGGIYTNDYEPVSSVASAGYYRVRAIATSKNPYPTSKTDYIEMIVSPYQVTTSLYDTVADAVFATAGNHAGKASYAVVVPDGNWQYAMIGAGLAAAGNGVVANSGKEDISSASLRAIVANGADSALVLGGGTDIGAAVIGKINSQAPFAGGGGATSMTASTVQEMALQAYNNIRVYGATRFAHVAEWGKAAIVMSPVQCYDTTPAALYAAVKKAPVFFTNADGTLPSDVASILASGAFSEIAVVGSSSLVPDSTLSAIGSAGGALTKRLLSENVTSGEVNRTFMAQMASDLGLSASKAVVASLDDPLNVILGAQLAADNGAALYTCASTADGKAVEKALNGADAQNAWLVGSFSATDPSIAERIASIATATPLSTDISAGDTIELDRVFFTVAGGGKAELTGLFDNDITALAVPAFVPLDGNAYTVSSLSTALIQACRSLTTLNVASPAITAIPASAFAGLTSLKSVSYAAAITSIGKNAFKGCTSLVTLNANVLKANSIGASAFMNCTSLKKLAFTSTKLTNISASMLQGCTKLTSVSFASKKVKKLGARAFSGAKKLKAITLKTSKLIAKNVGKNAFKGIANKAKVKVPKKKVSAYAKIFAAKGLPKKAKVK